MTTKAKDFYFLDLETTGLDYESHEIIEIGCIHTQWGGKRFATIDDFHIKVRPEFPPSPEVAAINGYSKEGWGGACSIEFALERFERWLGTNCDAHWAGSNVTGFDLQFLRAVGLERRDFSHRALNIESLGMVLWLQGKTRGCGLRHLRQWAGLDGEQAHRALRDAHDAVTVANALMAHFMTEG